MLRNNLREPLAKIVCAILGHVCVDPSCLPDAVVELMSRDDMPDAVCLRCQLLFDTERIPHPLLIGATAGFNLVPHRERNRTQPVPGISRHANR